MLSKIDEALKKKIVIGSIIGFLLILILMFAPYGSKKIVLAEETMYIAVSGFTLAFGGKYKISYSGSEGTENTTKSLAAQGGATTIFIFILLLVGLLVFLYFQLQGKYKKVPVVATDSVLTLFTFITAVMIFSVVGMTGLGTNLGWGAIIGGLIGLVIFLGLLLLLVKDIADGGYCSKCSLGKKESTLEEKILEAKKLYDDGLITEEQYEKKKEEILFTDKNE